MVSFKMASCIKLYIYLVCIAIPSVWGYCNETFNDEQCAYDMYCVDLFEEQRSWDQYRFIHRMPGEESQSEDCVPTIIYSGNLVYPIHLKYKASDNDEGISPLLQIPKWPYHVNAINFINFLDLSKCNYDVIPPIREMENLRILKLSENLLTSAKLSNAIQISSLTEIDLSHNTINEILHVSDGDYPYKGLKKVDLSYNYLIQISDAVFDPFDKLEILDVSHNYIDTLGSITFEGTKDLKYLNLSNNRIADINSSLFRFNELISLDLSNNKIKSVKVNDFNNLSHLKTLDLSSNFLSHVERDTFQNMGHLNTLYLNDNKLTDIEKDAFTNNVNLRTIDISENYFQRLSKGVFKSKNISTFSITSNKLEGAIERGTFEGLIVTKLDLSSQRLETISDYGFFGLDRVMVLLLNNNKIQMLSTKCFRMLNNLKRLDLSFNRIANLDFEKDDLFNLISLSLRNNHLTVVRHEHFHGLNSLQFLDLSDNKITQVESNSFKSLKDLINFEISNNPLSGTLEESTFDSMNSLPSLDISCSLLTVIQNGSFNGMVQLKHLNVSHSKINTIQFNIFVHTGALETIDLSYNELTEFNINNTELANLGTLYLNNNRIKMVDSTALHSLSRLTKIVLSRNFIENIEYNTFANQKYLNNVDLSYNSKLKFSMLLLNETKSLSVLNLSGIKTGITFSAVKEVSLSQLTISNMSITDVKKLQVNELQQLDTLVMSNNDISKLEVGGFSQMSDLRYLDLSYNKITYIQPGVFKDNIMLSSLNVSHNLLSSLSYGIFRGLIYLHTLDVSYNKINDLQNERFYELSSLGVLVADNNKIYSISSEQFVGTSLSELSIGENPIPCDILVNFKRNGVPFQVTAIKLDEHAHENVDGVSCNKKTHAHDQVISTGYPSNDDKILVSIRDILLNHFNNYEITTSKTNNIDEKYFNNITDRIEKSNVDNTNRIIDSIKGIEDTQKNNESNVLLEKILRVITDVKTLVRKAPTIEVTKDNATYDNLLSYINKMKQDLEDTISLEKNDILDEVQKRISASRVQINSLPPPDAPKNEKLSAATNDTKSIFTETCVALILLILVGFILYKLVYKSGIFVRRSFSVSTRELPSNMDSTL